MFGDGPLGIGNVRIVVHGGFSGVSSRVRDLRRRHLSVPASGSFTSSQSISYYWRGGTERFSLMAKNIYVGNLSWDATSDDLYALFQEHGAVKRAQVISDKETGRSRGFGFVEMSNDAEAQKAIDALNGSTYRGRPLTVNEARPREERGSGGGGRGGY